MSRKIFFFSLYLLFIMPLALFGQGDLQRVKQEFLNPKSEYVLVAAHRACHNQAPENSLLAIENAIHKGIDIIEIDVRMTKDNVPVLMHDGTIDRTTTASGNIEEIEYKDLKNVFLKDGQEDNQLLVPTLQEALEIAYGKIMIDLDMKTDRTEAVIDAVRATHTERQVFFFDSDYDVLRTIIKKDGSFMIMPRAYSLKQLKKAIREFNPPVVHIDPGFYSEKTVRYAKKHHTRIWINALGDTDVALGQHNESPLKNLVKGGANIIQTDEPEKLLLYLKNSGLHW